MKGSTPIVHAFIATFLALGMAAGGKTLQRAGTHIRDLLSDDTMSRESAEILETVLVGIEAEEPEPPESLSTYSWLIDLADFPATAH
jgi:hypothetical protein